MSDTPNPAALAALVATIREHAGADRWVCEKPRADGSALVYATSRGPLRVVVPIAETAAEYGPAIAALHNMAGDVVTALDRLAELEAGGDQNLHLDLVCGAAVHEGKIARAEGGCGKPFERELTYRCTDCGVVFHRECARRHFGKEHDHG